MTIGVLNQALLGVQENQRRFERAADQVVQATTAGQAAPAVGAPPIDLAGAAVQMMTARRGVEACLAVARSGDELLGTVIDVLA